VIKRDNNGLRKFLATVVPAGVLSWALAMLTVSYLGYAKVDAAFISSLVTSVLAVYGISRKEEDKGEPTKPPGPGRPPKSGAS
jgi:uncharacterized membrane protein YjjB (DUF3815 family)